MRRAIRTARLLRLPAWPPPASGLCSFVPAARLPVFFRSRRPESCRNRLPARSLQPASGASEDPPCLLPSSRSAADDGARPLAPCLFASAASPPDRLQGLRGVSSPLGCL